MVLSLELDEQQNSNNMKNQQIAKLLLQLLTEENSDPCEQVKESIEVGKNYFIRTLSYHYTGHVERVTKDEILLNKAAWIADSGRFQQALENCIFNEVEMFPNGSTVVINRNMLVDAMQIKTLPIEQK